MKIKRDSEKALKQLAKGFPQQKNGRFLDSKQTCILKKLGEPNQVAKI